MRWLARYERNWSIRQLVSDPMRPSFVHHSVAVLIEPARPVMAGRKWDQLDVILKKADRCLLRLRRNALRAQPYRSAIGGAFEPLRR